MLLKNVHFCENGQEKELFKRKTRLSCSSIGLFLLLSLRLQKLKDLHYIRINKLHYEYNKYIHLVD